MYSRSGFLCVCLAMMAVALTAVTANESPVRLVDLCVHVFVQMIRLTHEDCSYMLLLLCSSWHPFHRTTTSVSSKRSISSIPIRTFATIRPTLWKIVPNWDPVTLLASHDATGIKISVTIANLAGIISIATITNTNFTFNTIVSFVIPKAGVDVLLAVPGGTVNPKRDVSSKKRDIPVPSGFR